MKIDRNFQRGLLEILADLYPKSDKQGRLFENAPTHAEEERVLANLLYLEEHGLVRSGAELSITGSIIYQGGATITAAGLDFLEDDGGLTAILGTVTIKLHADTIRDLMLAKIDASPAPAAEKSALRKAVSTLSGEALKEIAKKLVSRGMESAPDAIAYLKDLLN